MWQDVKKTKCHAQNYTTTSHGIATLPNCCTKPHNLQAIRLFCTVSMCTAVLNWAPGEVPLRPPEATCPHPADSFAELGGWFTLGAPRSARRSRCLEKMPGRLQQKVQVLFFWRRTWIQCRLSKETETYLDYVDFDSVDEVRCSLGQVQMLDVNPVRRFQAFVSPMPPVPPPLAP